VQGPVAALGQQLVGPHHDDRVVVLDRDLEVVEAVLLEQGRLPHRGLDERLGGRLAVLGQQARVEGAGVDADADRDAGVGRRAGDLLDLVVELADVARVDADGRATGVDRGEDVLRLEVDVRDDRELGLARDHRQRVRVVLGRHRDAHDVTAGGRQLGDLLQGRVDVGGRRRAHGLHAHRGVPADGDLAHLDLARASPRGQDRCRCLGHAKADRDAHRPSIAPTVPPAPCEGV
jgi:hypothetical protein